MPFNTTGSVVSTDLDNMVRGLYRDNSDSAVTGTVAETTAKSVNIAGGTIGATGGLHVIAAGTSAGAGGTKTIRIKFATTVMDVIVTPAGSNNNWHFDIWIFNVTTATQRVLVRDTLAGTVNVQAFYQTMAVDTTANQTLALTVQLANVGDTMTVTMFDVFVVQIT